MKKEIIEQITELGGEVKECSSLLNTLENIKFNTHLYQHSWEDNLESTNKSKRLL